MNKLNVQFLTTDKGERLAVLPANDLEAMIEALEDITDTAAAERIMAKIRAGEEELIPADYADRMIDGENPIKVYREYRNMSGKQLAEAAGLSSAYLSQIETGKRQGTMDVMSRIAKALGVGLDDLVIDELR